MYTVLKAASGGTTGAGEGVVGLSGDVRVGPIPPSGCQEATMEFLPLAKGWLQIEGVRVVEYDTGNLIDVWDLPDVLVSDA